MHPFEAFSVLIFLGLVMSVYCLAGAFLTAWVMDRLRRQAPLQVPWKRRLRAASWAGAVLGIGCMAYGYWVEPYWPEVTHTRLSSAKVSQPLRIVLISDLHSDPKVRLEDRLPALIAGEKPEVILFAGDAVNSPEGRVNFKRCMTQLSRIAPTFAVKGNWDTWLWPGLDLFGETGVRELHGETVKLRVRNTDLWVVGIQADGQPLADKLMGSVPREALTVFLHHYPYPDILSDESRRRIDLFCAGHVHGGQVALPVYGALLTLSRWGKTFERGLNYAGPMPLYVTRGIGMEGGSAPRVRFCARPEISVIDFVPPG